MIEFDENYFLDAFQKNTTPFDVTSESEIIFEFVIWYDRDGNIIEE